MIVGTNLKFYTSVAKMLKLKVKMLWRLNPVFVEVNGEKLIGVGSFLDSPILNRVNIKMYLPYFFYFIITDFKRMIPFLWDPRIYLKQNIWKNESQRKLFFARFKTEVNHTERNFFLGDYGSGKRRLSKKFEFVFQLVRNEVIVIYLWIQTTVIISFPYKLRLSQEMSIF